MNVAALNHALRNIPAEQLRMHLCWGNYPGPHTCDVALGDIADIVWSARPQTVLLEGANPRHAHEFAYFEEHPLPEGKVLCPGMIEPQSPYVEHPELIAQRIGRYADLLGRERVMAGVDCGFSVHAGSGASIPRWSGPSSRRWPKAPRSRARATGKNRAPPATSCGAGVAEW